jgi:hypothetical protein
MCTRISNVLRAVLLLEPVEERLVNKAIKLLSNKSFERSISVDVIMTKDLL